MVETACNQWQQGDASTHSQRGSGICLCTQVIVVLAVCSININLHQVDLAAVVCGGIGAGCHGTLTRGRRVDHPRGEFAIGAQVQRFAAAS